MLFNGFSLGFRRLGSVVRSYQWSTPGKLNAEIIFFCPGWCHNPFTALPSVSFRVWMVGGFFCIYIIPTSLNEYP